VPKRVFLTNAKQILKVAYNCTPKFPMTFFRHSLEISRFHPCFRPANLEIYICNCTIHLLQLQIPFYICRNCDQLHVKVCPAFWSRLNI